jgi:hypothetical protein
MHGGAGQVSEGRQQEAEAVRTIQTRLVVEVVTSDSMLTPLNNVNVTVFRPDAIGCLDNRIAAAQTSDAGTAVIDSLPPGAYIVSVKRIGARTVNAEILLKPGSSDTLRISLIWEPWH